MLDGTREDVQVFDAKGAYLATFGDTGSGRIGCPSGILVHEDRVLVSEGCDVHGISEFKTDGAFVQRVRSADFGNNADIELGPDGRLYIADWDGAIKVVDLETLSVVAAVKVGVGYPASTVQGLAVLPDGRLVAAEWNFNKAEIFAAPPE